MAKPAFQLHTTDDIAMQLAHRIRVERLSRNWKQETLADRSGVSLPTIRRYERTGRTSVENLLKLCHALGKLDEFAALLKPAPVSSMDELEARAADGLPKRKRGVR